MKRYVIMSWAKDGTPQFWNNDLGWRDLKGDIYTEVERQTVNLPMGDHVEWVEFTIR